METAKTTYTEQTKKSRWKKITLVIVGIILILLTSAVIFVNVYINRSLPEIEGEVQLTGLQEPVEVTRDENGVPHIEAANTEDLFRAQGYVQAQDRLFQMELARRQASGTLSEVVGKATVDQDKYFRTLGLRRAAEKSLDVYSDEALKILEAYADGVNAYIEEAKAENRLSPEFALMGITPSSWTPIDSLTIGKYMAFDLGGHWERQAFNYYLMSQYPKEKAYELFPTYPEGAPTILEETEIIDVASSFEKAVLPHEFNGSNNWVVNGDRTASGFPMLADDPHLGLATPSIWYQMHLQSPEYNVSGVIFAGIPGIILGHNDQIAWGVTNVGPDVQQLYLEKRNPDNPDQFLFEDQWEEAEVIEEPIKVKDGETVEYEVVETRHGPVISEFAEQSGKDTVMSLRWTALDPTTELEAVLEINQASDWAEFEKGLEKFLAPAQNFVFASKDGTIAYKANGRIPIYENPDDALLPMKGWEEEDLWQGYIPFDELPKTVNPKKGFVATANNKVTDDSYPYHISHNWAQPYRYQRIVQIIEENDELDEDIVMDMQMDVKNLQAEEFVPYFLDTIEKSDLSNSEKDALALMEEWNWEDQKDLAQSLIYHRWMLNLQDVLYRKELPKEMMDLFHGAGQTTDDLLRQARSGEGSIWVEEAGGIYAAMTKAYQMTIDELTQKFGDNPADWEWGEYHAVEFTHPLSSISYLERFFNPGDPSPVSGSRVTVRAAGYKENGLVNHGASWRFIIDLENTQQAYHIVGPGQSGHFKSDWYHDQLDDWVEGDYHLTQTKNFKGDQLTLTPS
ncbi:penicillin acylase family protein [Halobacillus sp. BBL2006]|uniref:penicillin acylase family protein n=1 Tax=Halobacillus sp. BBL2006 TaxID=1543706 RepID=UPI000542C7AC|nr:penicillin acylase family protein [Halobacillus sp. BBL2006]KHE70161.1 beta-lactam antibiotic acylase [Halobacillus sp. BBL2006]